MIVDNQFVEVVVLVNGDILIKHKQTNTTTQINPNQLSGVKITTNGGIKSLVSPTTQNSVLIS